MEVSLPFRVVLLFHSIFFIGFLINTNFVHIGCSQSHSFFFSFSFLPISRPCGFYSANIKDGRTSCVQIETECWCVKADYIVVVGPGWFLVLVFCACGPFFVCEKKGKKNMRKKKINFVFWKNSWHYHLSRCFTTSVLWLCCSKYSHGRSKLCHFLFSLLK